MQFGRLFRLQTFKNNRVPQKIILRWISNPFVISGFITICIIFLLPELFTKYTAETLHITKLPPGEFYYYSDLNNDGISDEIRIQEILGSFYSVTVFNNGHTLDEWNFNGQYLFFDKIMTSKTEHDNFKSIYFFSYNKNAIYLNCLNPFKNKFITKNKFIAKFTPKFNGIDFGIIKKIFYDSNKDGIKEFYFSAGASYSGGIRREYKYDPVSDTLYRGGDIYAGLTDKFVVDTSANNFCIIEATNAVGNNNINLPYTDMYAWLMCYDKNLVLKNEPLRIGYYPSNSMITEINLNNKKYYVVLNVYTGDQSHPSGLTLYNAGLRLIKKKEFDYTNDWENLSLFSGGDDYFYIARSNGTIEKYNSDFKVIKKIYADADQLIFTDDLNGDGKNEIIFSNKELNGFIITSNDFSYLTRLENNSSAGYMAHSIKINQYGRRTIVMSADKACYEVLYEPNNLYYLRYPFYAGIYFSVVMFLLLLEKVQKHRAELKYETEKRIAELQIKSIKNQIDPHFTLNIINSIGSLLYRQDKEKADYIFGKYSKLLRTTILNSDKIVTTLGEEIAYVENYLELERYRNGYKFNWRIDFDERADKKLEIPKMLIHTFVENAIKHGLRHLNKDGELYIAIDKCKEDYQIIIRDNGIGRKLSGEIEKGDTGKGLGILDNILELYYSLMRRNITYEIKDLSDEAGNNAGTKVTIMIPADE